jgi:hypothetical protein
MGESVTTYLTQVRSKKASGKVPSKFREGECTRSVEARNERREETEEMSLSSTLNRKMEMMREPGGIMCWVVMVIVVFLRTSA